jgi:Mg-chelatase subunit ChlD
MNTPFLYRKRVLTLAAGLCLLVGPGCGQSPTSPVGGPPGPGPGPKHGAARKDVTYIDLPKGESRPGTAVVVLVDTSGSMAQSVFDHAGARRPKYQIAREALERIIEQTGKWKKDHPDSHLQMGIYHFSGMVAPVLPMGDFDQDKAQAALARIPSPNGGTAIGRALEDAFKALYRSGCRRKFVVCVTDGENTSGPEPDRVARLLFAQTSGEVEMDFVAFDTSARQFKFLGQVNGHAVEAADGAQLQKELSKIYKDKILAEAPDSPK